MMKATRRILLTLAFILLMSLSVYAANYPVTVFFEGKPIKMPVEPVIENGRTLVPFRALFETMGLEVGWDAATKTVTGKNSSTDISFVIGQSTALVNGEAKALDAPAKIVKGNTLVPVRFVGEASGYPVNWDGTNRRVIVGTKSIDGDIILSSSNVKANVDLLYAEEGTGSRVGQRRLRGYPGEDEFAVYFTGGVNNGITSYSCTYEDLRGLSLQQKISWTYNGKTYTNSRLEIYNFINDTSSLASLLKAEQGVFSNEWLQKTFGTVYDDWFKGRLFLQDADRLVGQFIDREAGVTYKDRFAPMPSIPEENRVTPPLDIDGIVPREENAAMEEAREEFRAEWISEYDLKNKHGITLVWMGEEIKLMKGNWNYVIPNAPTSSFVEGKIYSGNGIRFQYVEAIEAGGETFSIRSICLSIDDLKEQDII